VVTGLAQVPLSRQSERAADCAGDGSIIGSRIICQAFTGQRYFHSRPSAGNYYAPNTNPSQLGPTNKKLIYRVNGNVARLRAENPDVPVPVDMVTASASGLDPEITPAAAAFQVHRVAIERGTPRS
jgi:K+-transporting ATPase ATPase C chain